MSSVSIIIPVYKKLNEFAINLENNIQFLNDCELIIVNDDPETHLPEQLPSKNIDLSKITWINNAKNQGFGQSVNIAAAHATSDYILLLNTDVKLLDDSWKRVVPELQKNEKVFAVSFAQKEKNERKVGRNELYFKDGLFHHRALSFNSTLTNEHLALLPTAWAEGGSALFRKSMWDTLKGFDIAYSPFYWEDVDLSYRATQRGWQVYFTPSVVVEHHHESTIGSLYTKNQIKSIAFRNQLFFTAKFATGIQKIQYFLFRYLIHPLHKMQILHEHSQ